MKRTIRFAAVSILLVLLYSTRSLAGPVPDTGQTKCYDNSTEIPCTQPGEAFYGQDANYNINPPSYTKLDANGDGKVGLAEVVYIMQEVAGLR